MRRSLFLIVAVATIALTACGAGDEGAQGTTTPDIETDDGGEGGGEAATDDGGSGSSGNSEPPDSLSDEFAVGIAPGWQVDLLGEIGMTNTTGAQLLYPEDSFEEVVAYYDDWTSSQSVEYARTEVDGEIVYQSLETPIVLITVSPGHEERGDRFTFLLIAVADGS